MITRLTIENYQSIGRADLALGRLNVIFGPGMLGKSALFRALNALIFNESGSDFIRQGTKRCEVSVTLGDDEDDAEIRWSRDSEGACYVVTVGEDEQTFRKLGGDTPPLIRDLLRIRRIDIDKTFSITPQIHGQHDQPLLLTESAGRAARTLATLTKLDVIMHAQMEAARDLRREKQEKTRQEANVVELEDKLESLPDLSTAAETLDEARKLLAALFDEWRRLDSAGDLADNIEELTRFLSVPAPSTDELEPIAADLTRLAEAVKARAMLVIAEQLVSDAAKKERVEEELLSQAQRDLDMFMDSLEVCPLCEREMPKPEAGK